MDTLTDVDVEADANAGASASSERDRTPTADDATHAAAQRGTLLGRYVLLERIGVGGMGSVYAAYDPELDRRVALKLLGGDATERGRARLLREAQAMARVSHPNVITVHDVGRYADGVFLAMELVDGSDLRTWLRATKRPWPEILEAFIAAGRGLSAAHAVGLVHRDFKPANVLRGDDGTIRVVDFGLARLTHGHLSSPDANDDEAHALGPSADPSTDPVSGAVALISSEVELTKTGTLMGTPAYMAPEQHVRGEIEPRTDQFGFCVALYEALYGARPFTAPNRMALMFKVGRGEVPPPPRGSDVPVRLHAVLSRGLRPEAADRYPTMDALVAALSTDPARTRRRLALLGVASAAAVGGAFAIGRADLSQTAEPCQGADERMRGVWDAERRTAVADAFAATELPYATRSAGWVADNLDIWRADWIEEHTEACTATAIRGEQSEALLDRRMLCLEAQRGDVLAIVDMLAEADAQVVRRADRAVEGLPAIAECADPSRLGTVMALPDDAATRSAAAEIEAALSRARALQTAGRYDEGLVASEEAVERARALDFAPLLADALNLAGLAKSRNGDKKGAAETWHEAATAATVASDDRCLAEIWTSLVHNVGLDHSRHDEALRWARYARAAAERAGNPPPEVVELEHAVGSVLWAAGRHDEALVNLKRALDLQLQLGPSSTMVAHVLTTIGNVEVRRGQPQRALEAFERAFTLLHDAYGDEHPQIAVAYNALGVAHYHLGDLEAAGAQYERAYAINLEVLGPDHPDLLFSLGNIGNIRREQGRFEEALDAMLRVEKLVAKTFPPIHRDTGMTAHNIGEVLLQMGRATDALPYYRNALDIREQVHGTEGRYVANTLTGLGETLIELKRAREAVPHLERALTIRKAAETDARQTARTQFALARALVDQPGHGARVRSLATAARAALPDIDGHTANEEREALDAFIARLKGDPVELQRGG